MGEAVLIPSLEIINFDQYDTEIPHVIISACMLITSISQLQFKLLNIFQFDTRYFKQIRLIVLLLLFPLNMHREIEKNILWHEINKYE